MARAWICAKRSALLAVGRAPQGVFRSGPRHHVQAVPATVLGEAKQRTLPLTRQALRQGRFDEMILVLEDEECMRARWWQRPCASWATPWSTPLMSLEAYPFRVATHIRSACGFPTRTFLECAALSEQVESVEPCTLYWQIPISKAEYCVFRSLLDSGDELSWTAGTAGAGHSVRLSWSFPNRGREHLFSFVQSPSWVIQGAGATS